MDMNWRACGSGGSGALLSGTRDDCSVFVPVKSPRGVSACPSLRPLVSTSGQHTALLCRASAADACSVLYLAGENEHGQLATAPSAPVLIPVLVRLPRRIARVALGWEHTTLLMEDGDVLCAGRGCAVEDSGAKSPWSRVRGLPPCRDVACGRAHTVALSRDGTSIFTWGWGALERHGLLPGQPVAPAGGVEASCSLIAHPLGPVSALLYVDPPPLSPEAPAAATATAEAAPPSPRRLFVGVACGWQHSAVLCSDGAVIAWGSNRHGQCGIDPVPGDAAPATGGRRGVVPPGFVAGLGPGTPFRAEGIYSGWTHMAALARGAETAGAEETGAAPAAAGAPPRPPPLVVLTWGRTDLGQLGRPVLPRDPAGVEGGGADGPSWRPSPVRLPIAAECSGGAEPEPAAVACGAEHVLCVAACGCALAWGWNEHGNLGLGHSSSCPRPVRVGGVGCGGAAGVRRVVSVVAGGAASFIELESD